MMNSKLNLVANENFGDMQCAFYRQDGSDEVLMTREQIGEALDYCDPGDAISKIHRRHLDRLDKYSTRVPVDKGQLSGVDKLSSPNNTGGVQDTVLYSIEGVMEICRWSRQPKADDFMDFTWKVMKRLMKGDAQLVPATLASGELAVLNQRMGEVMTMFTSVTDAQERIEKQVGEMSGRLSRVDTRTNYTNYYLRLQARSGYDQQWEAKSFKLVTAVAERLNIETLALLHRIYQEMERRYGIVLAEFVNDYKKVKKVSQCSTLSVVSFSFGLREMFDAVVGELCDVCKINRGEDTGGLVESVARFLDEMDAAVAEDEAV